MPTKTTKKPKHHADPHRDPKFSKPVEAIVPFWNYVAKYLLGAAFSEQDGTVRKALYKAAADVDMAAVSLGLQSILVMDAKKVEKAAGEFVKQFNAQAKAAGLVE